MTFSCEKYDINLELLNGYNGLLNSARLPVSMSMRIGCREN